MSAPCSTGAPALSGASCERGCTKTEARSHTKSKPETANLVLTPRFIPAGRGAIGFVTVLLTGSKTCNVARLFLPFRATKPKAP